MADEPRERASETEAGDPVLTARSISVVRRGQSLLTDVSLAIPADVRLLVRGPSGAGKTTLFNVLGLLMRPSSGQVIVDGRDTSTLSDRERALLRRHHVGMVFQGFQLVPDLTARENAALPQVTAGDRDDEWLETLFRRLDITDVATQYPATLSGGEKQRVAIARALANRPRVVLADEPTGELDPETASRVLDLLVDLQTTTETALVVVSHDQTLGETFDRTVRLVDGRLHE